MRRQDADAFGFAAIGRDLVLAGDVLRYAHRPRLRNDVFRQHVRDLLHQGSLKWWLLEFGLRLGHYHSERGAGGPAESHRLDEPMRRQDTDARGPTSWRYVLLAGYVLWPEHE